MNETHGMRGSREYRSWISMMQRCTNPKASMYYRYGGRGIKVCAYWRDFANFYKDMGNRPQGKSLERNDNDGDYELRNCKWATPTEQSNNTISNRCLEVNGETKTVSQWCRELSINRFTVYTRLRRGWSPPRALQIIALTCLMVLPSLTVKAEEIVLPPSRAEIETFNACLRKGPMPCVLPTRTVIVPDDDTAPDMTPAPRQFYQAPPDELVNGSANTEMREHIRNAQGYRTYEWWIVRTQDGPPEPFGSYAQGRGADLGDTVDGNRGDDGGGDPSGDPGGGGNPGGGSGSGPSDPGGGPGGGSGPGAGGPGQAGGQDCRR